MKRIKDEKGSITIFVVATMLLFITVLAVNYSRQTDKLNNQKRQIREIEKQYNVDDELEAVYSAVKSKL